MYMYNNAQYPNIVYKYIVRTSLGSLSDNIGETSPQQVEKVKEYTHDLDVLLKIKA